MTFPTQADKPKLLMLSHCVPHATGTSDRVRSWQLLRLAARTHQVYLACVMDGPVKLDQWRAIRHHAKQIDMEMVSLRRRVIGRLSKWIKGPAGAPVVLNRSLKTTVRQWSKDASFDAAVCTHLSLCRHIQQIEASQRICDLQGVTRLVDLGLAKGHGASASWRERSWARRVYQDRRHLAPGCNAVIVDDPVWRTVFRSARRGRVILMPSALDLTAYPVGRLSAGRHEAVVTASRPTVVIHLDWSNRRSRNIWRWFVRSVWGSIQQCYPQAQLRHTKLKDTSQVTGLLAEATVVVCPEADSGWARVPVLQAMAMQKMVVAREPVGHALGARHNAHLLLVRSQGRWANDCVRAMRLARLGSRVPDSARTLVEQHHQLDQAGHEMVYAIQSARQIHLPLARAA